MSITLITLISCLLFSSPLYAITKPKYMIMLDPAGDAKQTGRTIEDSLERAITLTFAEALQQELEKGASCSVVITRSPGEMVPPLQNANFANRLPVNIYISLHCYSNPKEKHTLSIYHFSYHELPTHQPYDLTIVPYDKAHMKVYETTKQYGEHIKATLINGKPLFDVHGIYALPFYPLIGIRAPAIGIEINSIKPQDWRIYLNHCATAILSALEAR